MNKGRRIAGFSEGAPKGTSTRNRRPDAQVGCKRHGTPFAEHLQYRRNQRLASTKIPVARKNLLRHRRPTRSAARRPPPPRVRGLSARVRIFFCSAGEGCGRRGLFGENKNRQSGKTFFAHRFALQPDLRLFGDHASRDSEMFHGFGEYRTLAVFWRAGPRTGKTKAKKSRLQARKEGAGEKRSLSGYEMSGSPFPPHRRQ